MTVRRQLGRRIARAVARAAVSGQRSVVSLAAPADEIDPLGVISRAGAPFAYLEMPDRGFSIAALGETLSLEPGAGSDRFADASAGMRALVTRTHQLAIEGADRAPVLVGGFAFDDHGGWPGFPPARLVLPRLAHVRRGDLGTAWVATAEVGRADDPVAVAAQLIDRISRARQWHLQPVRPEVIEGPPDAEPNLEDDRSFLETAEEAVRVIRQGELRKVVVARRLDLGHRPQLGPFLATLREIHRGCAIFAFGAGQSTVFSGASPELLARAEGIQVSTLALAGTVPRGDNPLADELLARQLLNDPKEVEEHRYVLSDIVRRLKREGFAVGPPARTEVMKLPGVQHLATRIAAVAPVGTGVLDVVGALHPTPAVAGLPRERAMQWIADREDLERGWYAGAVGYCDLSGNGEFHVAIRSCLIEDECTGLFAGAGIVRDSSSERELTETELKLGALRPSVYGMNDHRWRTYATADTLLASLRAGGVAGVVLSPGSRSTPLALAAGAGGLPIWTVLDERSAGFVALGVGKASGRPAALICTSGSAAANYLPAVVEADRARVPMVLLTADRPPGHLDRDAPQTIDQVGLYGSHVREELDLPVAHRCHPKDVMEGTFRLLEAARAPHAGPVHINVPFARPLEPSPGSRAGTAVTPPGSTSEPTLRDTSVATLERFMARAERGLMIVGPGAFDPSEKAAIAELSDRAGWPLVADGMSGMRSAECAHLITTGDLLLRNPGFASRHLPDAVLRIGGTPTGTATQNWLATLDAPVAILDPDYRWSAPGPEVILRDPIAPLLAAVSPARSGGKWPQAWKAAEARARQVRQQERAHHPDTELAVAAAVLESERVVWVASSMPVRHVDAMMEPGCDVLVLGNRGACGIDGTIASACGAARALGQRVTVLVGDVALLHDAGSLATARQVDADLSIVVLDNGGGAIFEALPYLRSLREAGDSEAYRQGRELFVTPHDQDLVAVAAGFGAGAELVAPGGLGRALAASHERPGVQVMVVPSDPDAMFAAYHRLAEG